MLNILVLFCWHWCHSHCLQSQCRHPDWMMIPKFQRHRKHNSSPSHMWIFSKQEAKFLLHPWKTVLDKDQRVFKTAQKCHRSSRYHFSTTSHYATASKEMTGRWVAFQERCWRQRNLFCVRRPVFVWLSAPNKRIAKMTMNPCSNFQPKWRIASNNPTPALYHPLFLKASAISGIVGWLGYLDLMLPCYWRTETLLPMSWAWHMKMQFATNSPLWPRWIWSKRTKTMIERIWMLPSLHMKLVTSLGHLTMTRASWDWHYLLATVLLSDSSAEAILKFVENDPRAWCLRRNIGLEAVIVQYEKWASLNTGIDVLVTLYITVWTRDSSEDHDVFILSRDGFTQHQFHAGPHLISLVPLFYRYSAVPLLNCPESGSCDQRNAEPTRFYNLSLMCDECHYVSIEPLPSVTTADVRIVVAFIKERPGGLVSGHFMIGHKGANDHKIVRWSDATDVEYSKQGDGETTGLAKSKWEAPWKPSDNEPYFATGSLSHPSATDLLWLFSIRKKRTHLLSVHYRSWPW